MRRLEYPWPGLERRVVQSLGGVLPLVVYGSLMNERSAQMTLPVQSRSPVQPVYAYGVRRVFEYPMSTDAFERYGPPPEPDQVAALNVRVTGDRQDKINAVLVHIAADDLPALRERESGYHLSEVPIASWPSGGTNSTSVAFVLEGPPSPAVVRPHPRYVEVCRDGALSFGKAFREEFDATTFLMSGDTLATRLGS